MRYGFLGGIFDPVHIGHLLIAEAAKDLLDLEKMIFVPTGSPPHKIEASVSPFRHRLAMLKLAVAGNADFEISKIEASTSGKSYTVDTVRRLRETYTQDDLFWIIGSDNLQNLAKWRDPESLFHLCSLAVYPRYRFDPQKAPKAYLDRAIVLKAPVVDVSSSKIRKLVAEKRSIRYMVPEGVERYIKSRKIYRSGPKARAAAASGAK